MRKIFFILIAAITLTSGIVLADSCDHEPADIYRSYNYLNFGVAPIPLPAPVVGIGHRKQINQHGFDLSFQGSASAIPFWGTFIPIGYLKGRALKTYFFNPNPAGQTYVGFGAGTTAFTGWGERPVWTLSPEFTLGREYLTKKNRKRFLEMQVTPVQLCPEEGGGVFPLPFVTFSYGIGF